MVDRKAIKRLSTLAIVFTGANESRETFSQLPFASCWGSLSIFRQIDSLCRMSKCIEQPKPSRAGYTTLHSNWFVQFLTSLSLSSNLAPRARQRLALVLGEIFAQEPVPNERDSITDKFRSMRWICPTWGLAKVLTPEIYSGGPKKASQFLVLQIWGQRKHRVNSINSST